VAPGWIQTTAQVTRAGDRVRGQGPRPKGSLPRQPGHADDPSRYGQQPAAFAQLRTLPAFRWLIRAASAIITRVTTSPGLWRPDTAARTASADRGLGGMAVLPCPQSMRSCGGIVRWRAFRGLIFVKRIPRRSTMPRANWKRSAIRRQTGYLLRIHSLPVQAEALGGSDP
jgi:hypothetical protein